MRRSVYILIVLILFLISAFGCGNRDANTSMNKPNITVGKAPEIPAKDSEVGKGIPVDDKGVSEPVKGVPAADINTPSAGKDTPKDSPVPANGTNAADIATSGPPQGITTNKIPFTVLGDDAIPQDIKAFAERNQETSGYKAFEVSKNQYIVLISLGQRNTGGYGITVKLVEDIEGKTSVIVEETKPAPGSMVTQAITYPRVYIKIQNIAPNFIIKGIDGRSFPEYKN